MPQVQEKDAQGQLVFNEDGTPKMIEVPDETPPEEKVEKSAFDRVSKDMHTFKQKAADLQKQLDDAKVKGFKDKEDYKSAAEHHEAEAKTLKAQLDGLKTGLVENAINAELTKEATKQGIKPEALSDLELLDFPEITTETTSTGKILVSGTSTAIARLKQQRPFWFTSTVPSINSSTPNLELPITGLVTIEHLNAAEKKYLTTKSDADKIAYQDLIKKYKSQ